MKRGKNLDNYDIQQNFGPRDAKHHNTYCITPSSTILFYLKWKLHDIY